MNDPMAIQISCPRCGSRDARTARARTAGERLKELIGIYRLRCKRCDTAFKGSIWNPRLLFYARCPKCCRTQLSKWDEKHYNPRPWTVIKLRVGARAYRCEWCRCNFASFRACKEKFDALKHRGANQQPVESKTAT